MTLRPTRAEFAKRLRTFEGHYKVAFVRIVLVWLVGIAVMAAATIATAQSPNRWIGGVAIALMFASIFGGAFYFDRRRARAARDAEILCAGCHKALMHLDAKLAVTTGRCPFCGEPVISDP